ncbi:hypothetical protein ACIBG0_41800 [Nocardia sp. NPDC050630]|uniref:hypothetical protein n=1 Tax=Nocardia sp. NPDC050630 TaxID=3364321 RepID=UPI0037B0951D
MSVNILQIDEYEAKRLHEYAGTVDSLTAETVARWKSSCPDWKGLHWQMGLGEDGTYLGPVNVVTG